jgi:hypothetical protein
LVEQGCLKQETKRNTETNRLLTLKNTCLRAAAAATLARLNMRPLRDTERAHEKQRRTQALHTLPFL